MLPEFHIGFVMKVRPQNFLKGSICLRHKSKAVKIVKIGVDVLVELFDIQRGIIDGLLSEGVLPAEIKDGDDCYGRDGKCNGKAQYQL